MRGPRDVNKDEVKETLEARWRDFIPNSKEVSSSVTGLCNVPPVTRSVATVPGAWTAVYLCQPSSNVTLQRPISFCTSDTMYHQVSVDFTRAWAFWRNPVSMKKLVLLPYIFTLAWWRITEDLSDDKMIYCKCLCPLAKKVHVITSKVTLKRTPIGKFLAM